MSGSSRPLPHAILPAQAPPPFPEPKLYSARRVQGLVLTPSSHGAHATSLERRSSVAGNILLIDTEEGESKSHPHNSVRAFMLQRKIKSTRFGTVRVGYALQAKGEEDASNNGNSTTNAWEVVPNGDNAADDDDEDATELVAVTIKEKSKVLQMDHHANTAQDPKSELSAMQMVASLERDENHGHHVVGTNLVAVDDANVYTITPFCKEGSLFDYSMRHRQLSESDARFFFRQILKVRKAVGRRASLFVPVCCLTHVFFPLLRCRPWKRSSAWSCATAT